MTREEAIRRIKAWNLDSDDREVLAVVIPELVESEDEKIRKWIYSIIENLGYPADEDAEKELDEMQPLALAYLEKQKEQKPAEWSDEDKAFLKVAIAICNRYSHKDIADWLKSLRPQPHTVSIKDATKFGNLEYERGVKDGIQSEKSHQWKPSEEQMEALKCAVEDIARFSKRGGRQVEFENEPYYMALHSLYCNLEKLM